MPGVVLIVSIPDICLLPYFLYSHEYRLTRNTAYCAILSDHIVVGCPLGVPISYLYPRYEVYRGYIVFAFSVIMFVCLSVCLFVCKLFFFVKDFSATTWVRILKFGTRLDSDELYCVTKEQPHIAYQSLYLFIFLSLQWKNNLSKISQQLLGLGF